MVRTFAVLVLVAFLFNVSSSAPASGSGPEALSRRSCWSEQARPFTNRATAPTEYGTSVSLTHYVRGLPTDTANDILTYRGEVLVAIRNCTSSPSPLMLTH